jgi:tetrahydromethanopterin S-methyltransferase subunit C
MDRQETDPVDHARTVRKHAGESMKYGPNGFGLILIAIGVVAVVVCLAAFALGNVGAGGVAVVVAAVAFVAGGAWLGLMHRRVRIMEERYAADHPGAKSEPPTS